ncbi:MAG TPA: site-specific integrase [Streptosporangiaceae bacterium]|nr:site-specific integrase [Streptosporangiaceae bacterium]
MAVSDRWHKRRPAPGEALCEHGKVPTADHGQGDRWQARWRDDTGRQCKQNFAKRTDADAHDARVRASLTAGTYVDAAAGKVRFAAYADQWRCIQVHREQTTALTERSLRLYINPVIGDLPLAAVRSAHVQQLIKRLTDELAPSTVAVVYGYVASIFKSAVRDRLIGRTPCDGIRLPALPRRHMFIPDPAAVETVAGFLPCQYRVIPRAAARTGLRPSEMLGLEVECIDFLRREVHVRQQLVTSPAAGNVAYLAAPKTPQSERTVPVTAATIDLFAAHLAEFPPAGVEVEDRTDPRNPVRRAARLVFVTSQGQPVKRSTWSGVWNPAARKAGFPPRTGLHCCRHLFASALIRFGESVKTVQHLMGHSSPTVTLNVYAHLWPDADDRARLAVEAAFTDVREPTVSDHG